MTGGAGNDLLSGGEENDTLQGNDDDDTLFGGQSVLEPNEFCQKAYQKGLFPVTRIMNENRVSEKMQTRLKGCR